MTRWWITTGLLLLIDLGPAGAQSTTVEPYRNPNLAAIKSVAVPGWGQFGNDQPNKGTALIVNAVVALVFATDTFSVAEGGSGADLERALGWLAYGLGAVVGGYDAYRNAEHLNRENGYLLDQASAARPPGRGLRLVLLQRRF